MIQYPQVVKALNFIDIFLILINVVKNQESNEVENEYELIHFEFEDFRDEFD